jgi:hypothetical protein
MKRLLIYQLPGELVAQQLSNIAVKDARIINADKRADKTIKLKMSVEKSHGVAREISL